ncbi:allophanate hydrolase [Saccharobesus litoralis]|uniref:Allophanate hydrolase n=1 Tax=Saccharobesus litoralis TaxID=2172099 RepID=A0A2S0VPS5_9ALTE|nr:allophanate hydrolase subunit 1 [Saccharobesus litoralis]AWB66225.1 allophanate hydrolase [Saccharobesus litoralis]
MLTPPFPIIEVASENAYIVYFSQYSNVTTSASIAQYQARVKQLFGTALIDSIASFTSLLVIYDLSAIQAKQAKAYLDQTTQTLNTLDTQQEFEQAKTLCLPVYYDALYCPDLQAIAEQANLPVEDVIQIHSQSSYRVAAIGFAPGFAYLAEVDKRIAMPRLATPRKWVPQGAVGIADQQTAIYPASSPGGWNIIGLCPTQLFNLQQDPPMPFSIGQLVSFQAINQSEYLALGGELPDINQLNQG